MNSSLVNAAGALCKGRIVFIHEGGYSENYVSFCGCAVIEAMIGLHPRDYVNYPFLGEAASWSGQELQEHQWKVVDRVAVLHDLPRPESLVNTELRR